MLPQPRLEQEDEREQDPERLEQAAHQPICTSSRRLRVSVASTKCEPRGASTISDPTRRLAALGATRPPAGTG